MQTLEMDHSLSLPHGNLLYPAFLPDGTYGVVRSLDAADLEACQVQAVMMNSFHLMQRPGTSTVQSLGGLHAFSGWQGPIFTDSGGFQAYSLIRENAKFGSIHEKGLTFQPEGAARKYQLTPEKSIQLQAAMDSDVLICLDECTHVDAPVEEQRCAVQRTIAWAKRSKQAYNQLGEQKKWDDFNRPRLFAVIQGGGEPDLRRMCADALLEIGFDGFGFGGWPLDGEGNLLEEILLLTRQLVPRPFPMHALGVGHPYNVAACIGMGYDLSDSAMPTRDARHGRLYVYNQPIGQIQPFGSRDWMRYLYINDERNIRMDAPISSECDCPVCRRYSLGYLRHLFKMNDTLFQRLATMHNLRFMTQLTSRIREVQNGG